VIIVPRFGTIEWWHEIKKLWDADEVAVRLLKGFSTTMITKISDKPEIKPIFQRIEDGKLVEIRYAETDDKAEFVYEAPWEVWKEILQGKIEAPKAALTGKLKMTGPMSKMSKYMKGWIRTMDFQKRVPTEW
jgi:putative sterol carrier protein